MATPPHGPALAGALALALAAAACTSNRRTDMDGAVDLATEAGPSDGSESDAGTMTCQSIRICIATGEPLDICVKRGSPAAQDTFNQLLACLMAQPTPGCTGTDSACICPEECYADGLCLDETAACLDMSGATVDGVCDQYCGG